MEFYYWLGISNQSWVDRIWDLNFSGAYGKKVLYGFIGTLLLLTCVLCGLFYCFCLNAEYKDPTLVQPKSETSSDDGGEEL